MSILDSMLAKSKITATVLVRTQTMTKGVKSEVTWTPGTAYPCMFYRSGMAGGILGMIFKPDVSAYIVMRASDVQPSDFPNGSRVEVKRDSTSYGVFEVVYADDIAGLNELINIPLKAVDV